MPTADAASTQLLELAELGMSVVRRLAPAIEAAEDTKTLIALVDAHCDAGRGVRQSIALRMRIESGSFDKPRAAAEPDAEPEEREERGEERPERCDWNEYERPDWETPLRLTGDPAQDEAAIAAAVETAVIKIRKSYDRALAVLDPDHRPKGRAALLAGTAPLRVVDSS